MANIYYRKVTINATHPKEDEEKKRKTIRMTRSTVTKDGKKIVARAKRK